MNRTDNIPGSGLNRWAGYLVIGISLLHVLAFVAHPYWGDWLAGGLWTRTDEYESLVFFWALPGSFVATALLLGLLVVRLVRRNEYVPAYVGWGLAAWALSCVALIGPSGFLLVLVPAGLLIAGNVRARAAR